MGYSPVGVLPSPARSDGYLRWGIPWLGYPLVRPDGGYLRLGTPHQGTLQPGLTGGVPEVRFPPALAGPGRGTPPQPGLTGGVPEVGYPPAGLDWGTPPPTWTWPGYPPPPPGVDRQMDKQESKHNLPVVLRTRSVTMKLFMRFIDSNSNYRFRNGNKSTRLQEDICKFS